MSSAREVWRASEGLARQKTVRTIWPELAAALDGVSPASAESAAPPTLYCTSYDCFRLPRGRRNVATVRVGSPGGAAQCAACARKTDRLTFPLWTPEQKTRRGWV